MSINAKPVIGAWFKNEVGDSFEVVAWDEEGDYIEIQHYDGTIEELDLGDWNEYQIKAIEAPEDWSGSYDIQREDYGVDLDNSAAQQNRNPLDDLER